jgi:Rit1 N-terminal domain
VNMCEICEMLDKPLKPIFITPESSLEITMSGEYYPVFLVTASEVVSAGYKRLEGYVYVQGAADDEESWSHGLTSIQFWEHADELVQCTREDELTRKISRIVGNQVPTEVEYECSAIGASGISLGIGSSARGAATIICGNPGESTEKTLYVDISHKSKPVRVLTKTIFPSVISFALANGILDHSPVTILAIDTSRQTLDLSIAVALVLLTLFFNDDGTTLLTH